MKKMDTKFVFTEPMDGSVEKEGEPEEAEVEEDGGIIEKQADDIASHLIQVLTNQFRKREDREPTKEEICLLLEELSQERIGALMRGEDDEVVTAKDEGDEGDEGGEEEEEGEEEVDEGKEGEEEVDEGEEGDKGEIGNVIDEMEEGKVKREEEKETGKRKGEVEATHSPSKILCCEITDQNIDSNKQNLCQ